MMTIARTGFATLLLLAPVQVHAASQFQTAVLAGGCFWGVQSVFEHVSGVTDVVSGYAGGTRSGFAREGAEPSGFAEAVRITFDPALISYGQLLDIFFNVAHDPTQVDRQGPDVGPRYRSAIFPLNSDQRRIAQTYIDKLRISGQFSRPIATQIKSGGFEIASRDQQDFVRKHPNDPYVITNDVPKLADLKRRYPKLWRS